MNTFLNNQDIFLKRSKNFTVFKVVSIFTVVFDHFFEKQFPILWVAAAFALLIFAYSSSYFTASKYLSDFDTKNYWENKAMRIGLNFLIINIFLFVLFIVEKKADIFSWQTVIYLFGMKGFLYWFHIDNTGPFPGVTWFLTALILFYILYPLLRPFIKKFPTNLNVFLLITVGCIMILVSFLTKKIVCPHSLWLVVFGFLFGLIDSRINLRIQFSVGTILILIFLCFTIFINVKYSYKEFNTVLIEILFVLFVSTFSTITIPDFLFTFFNYASNFIFEIYVLHISLFLHIFKSETFNFFISVVLLIVVSVALSKIANHLRMSYVMHKTKIYQLFSGS